ncbi:MAG: hypothetical protein WBB07_02195 [Mycobacterium sp.]
MRSPVVATTAILAGVFLVSSALAGPAAAEPVPGPPPVPAIPDPVYGQGSMDQPLGYLGDMWAASMPTTHSARSLSHRCRRRALRPEPALRRRYLREPCR